MGPTGYKLLADLILIIHFAFVVFVVAGLVLTWIGYFARWNFVRNPWFRLGHLVAMGIVVTEALCGVICPLTAWEADLRLKAGEDQAYAGSFIQHWVHRVMFFQFSENIFTAIYVGFFVLIVLSFVLIRPRSFRLQPKV